MSATDELRERIAKALATGKAVGHTEEAWNTFIEVRVTRDYFLAMADDVLAVLPAPGPRMVSMEEAEELPDWSVIRDPQGTVLERWSHGSWVDLSENHPATLRAYQFPAQVLWTPEDVTE